MAYKEKTVTKKKVKAARVVPAHYFRTQLGSILEALQEHRRYVITKSGMPRAIVLSLDDYISEHPDYDDLEDFIDTLMEQKDRDFQESLRRSREEIAKGQYYTHTQLKKALAQKID